MITVHAEGNGRRSFSLLLQLIFPSMHSGATSTPAQSILGFVDIKKNSLLNVNAQSAVWRYPSISFRGWGGCTQATLRVICDLKYDQDICWMSSLVFIWWNWICLLNFGCDRDACWTWLIFDVLNVNVWNVHVECDVWPWIWSRCLLNLINFHVLNANVIVECDRYPCMWSNFAPFGLP